MCLCVFREENIVSAECKYMNIHYVREMNPFLLCLLEASKFHGSSKSKVIKLRGFYSASALTIRFAHINKIHGVTTGVKNLG